MMLYVFILIAVVSVVACVYIVLKGMGSDDSKAIPISDLGEIQNLRPESPSSFLKTSSSTSQPTILSQHLLKENLAKKTENSSLKPLPETSLSLPKDILSVSADEKIIAAESPKSETVVFSDPFSKKEKLVDGQAQTQERINQLIKENNELKEALTREVSSKDAVRLAQEERQRLAELEDFNQELKHSVNKLTQENYTLTKQNEQREVARAALEEGKRQLDERALDLQNESQNLSGEMDKMRINIQILSQELTARESFLLLKDQENTTLKTELNEKVKALQDMEQKLETVFNASEIQHSQNEYNFEQIQQEKEKLAFQLKVSELKVGEMKRAIDSLQEEINQKQNAVKLEVPPPLPEQTSPERVSLLTQLDEHRREKERLKQINADLELRLNKIREHNNQLVKKEGLLHYELSKSRAQALGLEKICASLKEHLDNLNKTQVA